MKFGIEKLKTIEIHSTATSRPGYFEACSKMIKEVNQKRVKEVQERSTSVLMSLTSKIENLRFLYCDGAAEQKQQSAKEFRLHP
ncbi:CLUMA_CG012290, isoform A [Clunio marinus]|uniref:CLUMA_CG012290, isoform A n=1 Tax=Clunio marinus TaxID=568069 RepID=A0A1J1IEX7_9DIPT|nr:CLUMA_CG012290, isoform A [Clunio marinus]